MIVYEVNLRVERGIETEYRRWLHAHMTQLLTLPGFVAAELFEVEVEDGADANAYVSLCVQYRLRDAAALDAYLREHAARLRADGVARFGQRFSAQRRVLRSLESPS